MSRPALALAVLAAVGCKPVDGVVYTDPSRPEAQDWSRPAAGGGDAPTDALHRERARLDGLSGPSLCHGRHRLQAAFDELARARPPAGDPDWNTRVARVRRAVDNIQRAMQAQCEGRAGPILSSELNELERALAELDG